MIPKQAFGRTGHMSTRVIFFPKYWLPPLALRHGHPTQKWLPTPQSLASNRFSGEQGNCADLTLKKHVV
jgi:hypothetical protein